MDADALLISQIASATQGARGLLTVLAGRGKALRRDEPARAEALLSAVRPHPAYKAARILFDLLELEDLMLDGPPVPADRTLEARAVEVALTVVQRLSTLATQAGAGAQLETASLHASPAGPTPAPLPPEAPPPAGWPELVAADYLFDLVVLGVLRQASRALAAQAATR